MSTVSAQDSTIRRVVIVGGGTAGWLTAGVLAARFPREGDCGLSITLVESRSQPPIGVGEGTWPTIRSTLQRLGVSETDFLRECDASFKQGTEFRGWVTGSADDAYFHPFTLPAGYESGNSAAYWTSGNFADRVCFQTTLCRRMRAPKTIATPEFAGVANYAYHLDAGKFVPFLERHCTHKLGVMHRYEEIVAVMADDSGAITRLTTRSGNELVADLYVDCSGFAALLIGRHYGVPFVSTRDILFADRAWAVQVAHASEEETLASVTRSSALSAGWVWDIALPTRRGMGYVYSSDHSSDDDALAELRAHLRQQSLQPSESAFRRIDIKAGYRREYWRHNCVAVGLSAGFLEPLEASAIVMIELSATAIANLLPGRREALAQAARIFNERFLYRWERIVDFLKLHYVLSRRADARFWIDNRNPASLPRSLRDGLDYWRDHCPWADDFAQREEVFSAASYQYILYGMGFLTNTPPGLRHEAERRRAHAAWDEAERHGQALAATLPTNRELLAKVRRFGLQKI